MVTGIHRTKLGKPEMENKKVNTTNINTFVFLSCLGFYKRHTII